MPVSGGEKGIVGETVEKGGLFHDLVDRVFDRWGVFDVGQRIEVQGDDCNAVGELL